MYICWSPVCYLSSRIPILGSYYIRNMSLQSEIRTFVFVDTETTGLPSLENNKTKITELCLIAVQASHIRLGVFPRVQNKLSLCFNPCKLISSDSEKITGLSNHLLEHLSNFTKDSVSSINNFLKHNPKPICFVAHNGNNFDYPILRREINRTDSSLSDDILCIDSLVTFQELYLEDMQKKVVKDEVDIGANRVPLEFTDEYDKLLFDEPEKQDTKCTDKIAIVQKINETTPKKQMMISHSDTSSEFCQPSKKMKLTPSTPAAKRNLRFDVSFKLGDVYSRLTKKSPQNVHQAEGDVLMLIMSAATMGDRFVDWANSNAKKFYDIPPMVPGKKIGT
ncbi:unnamed protein product [Phaedon cochleariae]|uniref:Exonuclease domain-containing protein n=1 Tax=Phaedon cochleariae TaxID=80249 RepID=A0A9P0GPZ1_PHACE|nr:unnamed protein product [Phaedon cochleariae]